MRADLQAALDDWHRLASWSIRTIRRRIEPSWARSATSFLQATTSASQTDNVDEEISSIPGPQLVVPLSNARYALNAANARWGSLYDALYGTDALGEPPPPGGYSAERGRKVIAWARAFLDDVVPLVERVACRRARLSGGRRATRGRIPGRETTRPSAAPRQFAGYRGEPDAPSAVLLRNNGLVIEVVIDRTHPIGSEDAAGVADVVLEAAVSVIMDCEDSVAAVSADEKVAVYRNWLGLMRGDLAEVVTKGGDVVHPDPFGRPDLHRPRWLGADTARPRPHADSQRRTSPHLVGRAVRRRGDSRGPARCHGHGAHRPPRPASRSDGRRNSRAGSIYVVKPKMHGPAEVAYCDEVFARVERVLGLPANTVKIGVMDEERRTTLNLKECIRAARTRLAFINTGFLDRTGDEIHTSMEAGPMVRKGDMRRQRWILAYEDWNVDTGLACGLAGRAQIGKGMWAAPDHMADMLAQKVSQPMAGANCAWVPSPTAAVLHATHYHRVDVHARQAALQGGMRRGRRMDDLLAIPLADAERHVDGGGAAGGTRQQRPGHLGVRRAVGRSGDRLFQGARHRKRRADGRPRHVPDLVTAHRQLAPSRAS